MADDCGQTATSHASPEGFLYCGLPKDHAGPHYDGSDELSWRVVTSRAIPRGTEAYLTPSADLPACRDEDPAQSAVLAATYPDPPEYAHPEDDWGRDGEPYERAEAEEIDAYWEASDE